MVTQIIVGLKNFFVFNPSLSTCEGDELDKILYYYPISDNTDIQIKNVGLVQGIINFTQTFQPSSPVGSLHTEKSRQLYYQPEKGYWMVMTLELKQFNKENVDVDSEELADSVQDNVYEAVLKQAYDRFRLFWGKFQGSKDTKTLKMNLELFYREYLQSLKLAHADILNIFSGIQYLPLDKQTFLKVQCLINLLESNHMMIAHSAFLYNDHLIWSGIEPSDMQVVYHYLIDTLLPVQRKKEMEGGSLPRNSPSPFAALRHGRFITGPSNLKLAKTVDSVPKVFFYGGQKPEEYYFVVYKALNATVCLFVKSETELSLDLFKELDDFISPKLISLSSDITEYCSKQVTTPNVADNSPKFIYFNNLNRAYKSTVHLDNKQSGNLTCMQDSLKIMADLKAHNTILAPSGETIVKTMNDYWVVGKISDAREFYIALQQKNTSLIDVSEEVRKLCETELKGIFFQ